MPRRTRRLRPLLPLLAAPACARSHAFSFRCADGAELRARFVSGGLRLEKPTGAATLRLLPSHEGEHFASDTLDVRERGGTAQVALRGRPLHARCRLTGRQ